MTYQEKLEAMSDGELNLLLAEIKHAGKAVGLLAGTGDSVAIKRDNANIFLYDYINYCNNYNDTMPLAIEKGLNFRTSNQKNCYVVDDLIKNRKFHCCIHKNPLRAAVIVLLLIDKENNNE